MATQDSGKYSAAIRTSGIRLGVNEPLVVATGGTVTLPSTTTIGGSSVSALGVVTSTSANALTVGPAGTTNPSFNVDASTASAATGLNIKSAAAAAGVALSVVSSGTNENLTVDAKGSGTVGINTVSTTSGLVTIGNSTSLAGVAVNGLIKGTSASANALVIGLNGSTNPAFNVDASTASSATGINVKSAAAAAGVVLSAISSATNENLTVNAKGSGTLNLNQSGGFTVFGGNLGVTTTSANALAVGPANVTNPTFNVDSSTASAATGLNVKGAAAGSGLAVSVISSGTNENLTVNAKGSGTVVIAGTSTGQVSIGRGGVGAIIESSTIGSLGTTQNSTPSAANLLGGVVTQTGATGAGTVTLPTGTQLSTAVIGVAVGDTFDCVFANLGGSQTLTITGATGSTVLGNAAVPTGKNAFLTFVNTGANTWNVYVIVSA
jgi:hypothetical protein